MASAFCVGPCGELFFYALPRGAPAGSFFCVFIGAPARDVRLSLLISSIAFVGWRALFHSSAASVDSSGEREISEYLKRYCVIRSLGSAAFVCCFIFLIVLLCAGGQLSTIPLHPSILVNATSRNISISDVNLGSSERSGEILCDCISTVRWDRLFLLISAVTFVCWRALFNNYASVRPFW